jgi:ribosomal protein L11 methylase PrmA
MILLLAALALFAADKPPQVVINPPYVTTPTPVVEAMVRLAEVKRDDIVYDLGCGDGRLVIAALRHGASRGVGIDLFPAHMATAKQHAVRAGVADRVEFRQADLFDSTFREATVVLMYLMPEINLKLRDRLRRDLRPGARIVSHAFDMGD